MARSFPCFAIGALVPLIPYLVGALIGASAG